jgi:PAS domain S-box-containing protein
MGGPGMARCPGWIESNLAFVKDPLHILHLEDSEADAVLISHELEKAGLHVEAHRVVTREEFARELEEYHPDIILSDHGLPNFDGFTALKLAKQKSPETPFIFVAESLHGESALETIKNGAADYILKSQVPQRLVPALRKALEAHGEWDISERRRMEREFEIHNRQQGAVASLGQKALAGMEMPALFREASNQVRTALQIEACCLFEIKAESGEVLLQSVLDDCEELSGKTILLGPRGSALSKAVSGEKPVVVVEEADESLQSISNLHGEALRTGILAVVHGPERPFGILAACSESARSFSKHDELFVQSMANVLGDAIVRARAEGQLRAGEERLRMLLEGVEDYAIYMLDLEGKVTSWNMGAQRIEGYKAEEIIGKDFSCFFPPEDVEKGVPAAVLQRVKTTGRVREDLWQVRKDGTLYWANLLLAPLRDDQGRLYGIAKVNHDMTLYKAAQEEIRRLNSTLEQRVRERTAQLEAVNKELETFSYSVSHDLRAPLRHIDGFADMLRQRTSGQLDETSLEYLGIITEATRQMSRLIDALLAFSRMGRAALTKSLLDSNKLVRGVLHDLSYDMEGRKIEWRIETLPQAVGDPALLRQVWFNLISNALKYTRVRDVATIEIGAKPAENEVAFFIKDNGVGFDMQYVDKLFGVFQRLHGAGEFEGTGIGLANVRRIVQRHGGRVWAEGEPDLGATFFFTLPKVAWGSGEPKR